ncbi:MAG: ATP-binding protein [Ginsengibacter sp.]
MKKYPFKFLDAYNREDTGIFFGRDEEIAALYEMVFQSPILLVYGASGTGKTSLIQCGLASKFQSHDWLALPIRRGGDINASFEKALTDAGGNVDETEDMDWLKEVMEEKEVATVNKTANPLEKSFKAIYLNSFRPIYLIFDQFEELFILGTKEEQQQFIETVKEILQVEQPVKMIFSIREEYLGHLNAFERAVPQLLRKKLRVEPMNLDKVRQVIVGATSYENSNVHLQDNETDAIAEGIFDKVKGTDKTLTIQLPYLQVFLDKFYLEITKDDTRRAEAVFTIEALNYIGDIGDVLRNFLEDQVAGISQRLCVNYPNLTIETVWKILSPFATLEGTKEPITNENLHDRLPDLDKPMIDAIVEAFVNSRILRYSDETNIYEIAHDSLAKRIAEKRSDEEIALLGIKSLIKSHTALKADGRELFSEKRLNYIEPYLSKINLAPEEKALIQQSREAIAKQKAVEKGQQEAEKQRLLERQLMLEKNQHSQKRFIRWMSAALILMIGLLIFAFHLQNVATSDELKAKNALQENRIQQAISKARESKAFGDSYLSLGDSSFACNSYTKGLSVLDSLAGDSKDTLPIFKELNELKRKLKCE